MNTTAPITALLAALSLAPPATAQSESGVNAFLDNLTQYCGGAFAGQVVTNEPVTGPDPFANRYLVMHVADCTPNQVRLHFFVSDDGLREWVLTRTKDGGLQLRHLHFASQRAPLVMNNYGGQTVDTGTATRQEFPVDAYSIQLFEAEDLSIARDNVWALEIKPDETLVYELAREDGRLLQIAFDLADPVELPESPLTLAAKRGGEDWEN